MFREAGYTYLAVCASSEILYLRWNRFPAYDLSWHRLVRKVRVQRCCYPLRTLPGKKTKSAQRAAKKLKFIHRASCGRESKCGDAGSIHKPGATAENRRSNFQG